MYCFRNLYFIKQLYFHYFTKINFILKVIFRFCEHINRTNNMTLNRKGYIFRITFKQVTIISIKYFKFRSIYIIFPLNGLTFNGAKLKWLFVYLELMNYFSIYNCNWWEPSLSWNPLIMKHNNASLYVDSMQTHKNFGFTHLLRLR